MSEQETPEPQCPLTNEELIEACNEWISKLCKTGGNAWMLQVPANFRKDPDILFIELGKRLAASQLSSDQIVRERLEGMRAEMVKELFLSHCHPDEEDTTMAYVRLHDAGRIVGDAIDRVLSLLSEAPPVSKWVKVEDREPTLEDCDANGKVLFWDNIDKEPFPFEPEHALQHPHYTHWQPLPTHPKD